MSARRNNANRIRGPQSALTDFLAANNISAQEIRDNYEARQRRNDAVNGQIAAEQQSTRQSADASTAESGEEVAPTASKKRKRVEDAKKDKDKKKKKKAASDDDDWDDLGADMYRKAKPKPGQLDNCELCSKRFTVTPYSKTGPDGGLLCTPCGKTQTNDQKKSERKAKSKAGTGQRRRKTESNRLDGLVNMGPKSLQQLCVERVAQYHGDIEEFGDLPDALLIRLSEIFSKKRIMDPRTLQLFLRQDLERVCINDAANLKVDDYKTIFAQVSHLKNLTLRNACQFKDEAVEYMLEKAQHIKHLQIYASNLVSDDVWIKLFTAYGEQLRTVKIEWNDAAFGDIVVDAIASHCPNIERLKLKFCRQLTSDCLRSIARLGHLRHLSLRLSSPVQPSELVELLEARGPTLETLSLEGFTDCDDTVVEALGRCAKLSKLRLTEVDSISDGAMAALFSREATRSVVPPLRFLDLSGARDVDSINHAGPEDQPIGLCSDAFRAAMRHSGEVLATLDVASCRYISSAAFGDVFDPRTHRYPQLRQVNVSFCNSVDTGVVRAMFASCPKLKKLIAFGCFKVEDVVVPAGVALIGVPRAQEAIEQFGEAGVDVDRALGMMDEMGSGFVGGGTVAVGA